MKGFERIRLAMMHPGDSPLVQSEASDAERDSKPVGNGSRDSLYVQSFSHAVIKNSDENIISPNEHNCLDEQSQLSRRTITIYHYGLAEQSPSFFLGLSSYLAVIMT